MDGQTPVTAFTNGHAPRIPDVSREMRADIVGVLHKVGMSNVQVQVLLADVDGCRTVAPALADAFVSLDNPADKGIHMSRLFLALQESLDRHRLGPETLKSALDEFLRSHAGQSSSAFIEVRLDHPLRRPALVSTNTGWRSYPVALGAGVRNGHVEFEASVQITYSSTCPCSAALSRDATQRAFLDRFPEGQVPRDDVADWLRSESGMPATPHSQRSIGTVKVRFTEPTHFPGFEALIDHLEGAIRTGVQAAVKREDELEFARLNAQNLMFCEDAARRLRAAIEEYPGISDYRIEARHVESLHPHDAVAVVTKGVPGGFVA
ncbi:MAG: GTP cyclohydrolase I FolE2 [Candidatus Eisenbacteria bacterium]|uniref:GTP cyclohydrolase FolE2 n=1 Tax=Eiseniibacteriota bacterium TaxID=2212470 RepID=A0A956LX54_UNCEI|nr:GTP cyclohydrolase I FolE2 [Candidatus Eisenbacteria bacterium]